MEESTTHQALVGKLLALHKEFIRNSEKVNFCQEVKNGLRTLTLSIQLPDNATSTIKRKKKQKSPSQKYREKVRLKAWIEKKNASSNKSTDTSCQNELSVFIPTVPSSNQQPQSLQIPQLDREQVKEYVDVSLHSDEKSLQKLTKYVPKTAAETDLREKKTFFHPDYWHNLRMHAKTDEEYLNLVEQEVYEYRSSLNTKELAELRARTERNGHFFSDESWENLGKHPTCRTYDI